MTDENVVQRAADLVGHSHPIRSDQREGRLTLYLLSVLGQGAEDVIRTVLPYMGERRSAKINECLNTPNLSHHPR